MDAKKINLFISLIITALLAACAPSGATAAGPADSGADTAAAAQASPTPSILLTATPIPGLLPQDVFSAGSDFCQPEVAGSSFTLECTEDSLTVDQAEGRRKVDALLLRGQTLDAAQFNLEADVTSVTALDVKADQNAYGFYFLDDDGFYKAVRIQGQYFHFETWNTSATPELETQLDPSFSPDIQYAGRENHLRLACVSDGCELYANDALVGRWQTGISGKVQSAGIFTASAWDESFGQVSFQSLSLSDSDAAMPPFTGYALQAKLTSDTGVFAATGMSGAFNLYDAEGFHFSPVIPFGYYSAKAGPALQSVDVRGTVVMDVNPEQSGSQYAGLVCRSSRAGMYMAVIGVDGSYSVYRDTPARPFSLLAEKRSDAILSGERAANTLRLVCSDDTIEFYINEQLVESLTDSRYLLNYGRAGIYTKAGGEPNEDAIIFRDLSVEEIE
ncbi:MAG: hypothetical protein PWQ55_1558 [Chloroflexota bacterium]|nr:hypothetical protein [Chloroflexota bacterium]